MQILKARWMNYFSEKLHIHTQNGGIIQGDNSEINVIIHCHTVVSHFKTTSHH